MGRLTAGVVAALRTTFTREELPPPTSGAEPEPRRLLRHLLAPESLPPPAGQPVASRPAGRGTLSRLLAPDPLPPDLPPEPRRGGRWLAWLLTPEKLEP